MGVGGRSPLSGSATNDVFCFQYSKINLVQFALLYCLIFLRTSCLIMSVSPTDFENRVSQILPNHTMLLYIYIFSCFSIGLKRALHYSPPKCDVFSTSSVLIKKKKTLQPINSRFFLKNLHSDNNLIYILLW